MAKVLMSRVRPGRVKRDHSPRITITRDGSARLSRSAHVALGTPDKVAIYHDSDDKSLFYVSRNGDEHRLSKYLAFGASQLHKYAGSPDHPVHVPLEFDADGDLRGDLRQAVHGQNRPWTAARRGTVNGSGVTAATAAPTQRNGRTVEASSTGLRDEMQPPVASAPPDFSYDEEYDPAY